MKCTIMFYEHFFNNRKMSIKVRYLLVHKQCHRNDISNQADFFLSSFIATKFCYTFRKLPIHILQKKSSVRSLKVHYRENSANDQHVVVSS